MISGKIKIHIIFVVYLSIASVVNAASIKKSTQASLNEIMTGFSKLESSLVYFKEEKFLSTHKNSILLKGSLSYKKPGYLKKQVDEPYAELIEIKGDQLWITDYDGYTQQVSLKTNPEVYLYVYAFRGVLSGDYDLLKKNFSISLDGGLNSWKMTFVPLREYSGDGLRSIIFEGRNASINTIEIMSRDDKSTLHLHDKK